MDFNKPFFVVGFNHTIMVRVHSLSCHLSYCRHSPDRLTRPLLQALLLPGVVFYHKLRDRHVLPLPSSSSHSLGFVATLERHSVLRTRELLRIAAFLSAFYCVADYFWYKALARVSVAAGTAIFNCSPLFVYCFSVCWLRERVTLLKLLGVATSFVGVTLILMFQDSGERLDVSAMAHLESASFVAGLLMVLSAACYGAYEVAFQVAVGASVTDTSTLLTLTGVSGLLTIPYWAIGSLVLAASPFEALYEPLGWPTTLSGLALLAASGACGFVFNVFLPLAISWTSPLETSVGCMLTIPLSAIVDAVVHHTRFSIECIAGSLLVLAGFGLLEYGASSAASSASGGAETVGIKPERRNGANV